MVVNNPRWDDSIDIRIAGASDDTVINIILPDNTKLSSHGEEMKRAGYSLEAVDETQVDKRALLKGPGTLARRSTMTIKL